MHILVDADACPRAAKELIFRTAQRRQIETVLVANGGMRVPQSPWIRLELVDQGSDVADDWIAAHATSGDIVITADIPLAARIVDKGAVGIDPRGLVYHENNVKDRLAARNLMFELREVGMMGGGPPPYKDKDKSKFASALDRLITSQLKVINS